MVHTGIRQLKIIWNLIQENVEDNYEFSSAEKHALNTQTYIGHKFYDEKIQAFLLLYGFTIYSGAWV